jgi:hypothetical protein
MTEQERNGKLATLALERCDELEEMAVKMAREIAHLRSMLLLTANSDAQVANTSFSSMKISGDKAERTAF